MSRRDMIIVAALLNSAIIAVLLIMAVTTDQESVLAPSLAYEHQSSLADTQDSAPRSNHLEPVTIDLEGTGLDGIFNDMASNSEELFIIDEDLQILANLPEKSTAKPKDQDSLSNSEMAGVKIVDITVKRGDSLDKIARANDTSIDSIKRLNQLKSERLSIGQQLKVPVGFKKVNKPTASRDTPTTPSGSNSVEYYTIKSGDNPWKIAKQFRLNMDELLRLNQLDEEKARNLKIGDKIRIR